MNTKTELDGQLLHSHMEKSECLIFIIGKASNRFLDCGWKYKKNELGAWLTYYCVKYIMLCSMLPLFLFSVIFSNKMTWAWVPLTLLIISPLIGGLVAKMMRSEKCWNFRYFNFVFFWLLQKFLHSKPSSKKTCHKLQYERNLSWRLHQVIELWIKSKIDKDSTKEDILKSKIYVITENCNYVEVLHHIWVLKDLTVHLEMYSKDEAELLVHVYSPPFFAKGSNHLYVCYENNHASRHITSCGSVPMYKKKYKRHCPDKNIIPSSVICQDIKEMDMDVHIDTKNEMKKLVVYLGKPEIEYKFEGVWGTFDNPTNVTHLKIEEDPIEVLMCAFQCFKDIPLDKKPTTQEQARL